MERRYGYKYAIVMENGFCRSTEDCTDYILDRLHIPIEDVTLPYLAKYYHPIPATVTSFSDFHGKWYSDAAFTIEVPELNG